MTWYGYGLTPDAWTFLVNVDGITPNLTIGTLTAYNQEVSGTLLGLSLDADGGTPVDSVTSSDGTDGQIIGTIPSFWAEVPSLYVDGNGGSGPRLFMQSRDAADIATAAASAAADNHDAVTSLNNLTASVPLFCVAVAGVFPVRPTAAGARVVIWIGPSAPSTGAGGAVEGDIWWKTAS